MSDIQLREVDGSGADVDQSSVDTGDVLDVIASRETSRFLGIWEGVLFSYRTLDENILARDLLRIERYYQARGYYDARVTATRLEPTDQHHVRAEIRVVAGRPVETATLELAGLEELPPSLTSELRGLMPLRIGRRLDERDIDATKAVIEERLQARGFAFARARVQARVDLARHAASVVVTVEPKRRATYGVISIVGLDTLPEDRVRSVLLFESGDAYSSTDLTAAEEALLDLGIFDSVRVRPDLSNPETDRVPITVVVKEGHLRSLVLGVGARADSLSLSNRLRLGWSDRNFAGGLRQFSIEDRPGVTYFPNRIGHFESPTRLLLENQLRTELRQPTLVEGRTTSFVQAEYNVFPLLYPIPDGVDPRDERIIGYHQLGSRVGAERKFFNSHLKLINSYNWQANFPFTYQGERPDGLDAVRVSYPEAEVQLDFRNDHVSPTFGVLIKTEVQVAGFIFGGTVSDVRLRPELRTYLPISSAVTLATRLTTGFLFPDDYGDTLADGVSGSVTNPNVIRDQHKLLFRAFYSGGPNSNRGYPLRGVGPHGPLGFLVPTGEDCTAEPLPPTCLRPLGGLSLWEASVELRLRATQHLFWVLFADGSDVTREVLAFRANYPHVSSGMGLRYGTPIGPLRVDLAYRIPGLQALGESTLPASEGDPSTIFGLPIALHLAIGEAF